VNLEAVASDPEGTVTQVAFYAGASLIGTVTTAPFATTWTGVPAGTYSLTAVAIDNVGVATTSTPITITVTAGFGEPVLLEDDFAAAAVDPVKWDIANLWSGPAERSVEVQSLNQQLRFG
jgi:hypothetical protein